MKAQIRQGYFLYFSSAITLICSLFFFVYLKVLHIPLYEQGSIAYTPLVSPISFSVAWDSHSLFEGEEVPVAFGKAYRLGGEFFIDNDRNCMPWLSIARDFLTNIRFIDETTKNSLENLQLYSLLTDTHSPLFPISITSDKADVVDQCIACLEHFLRKENCPSFYKNRILWAMNESKIYLVLDPEKSDIIQGCLLSARREESFPKNYHILNKYQKITPREVKILNQLRHEAFASCSLFTRRSVLESLLFTLFVCFLGYRCLMIFGPNVLVSVRRFAMYALVCALSLIGVKITEMICSFEWPHWGRGHCFSYPIVLPFTAIVLGYLLNVHLAAATCALLSVFYTIASDWNNSYFLSMNLLVSWYLLFTFKKTMRLTSVFVCSLHIVWFSFLTSVVLRCFMDELLPELLLADAISSCAYSIFTAIFSLAVILLLEYRFGEESHSCLLSYLDPDHPLLKRLFEEAPGTYQHSVLVGILSEAAAAAIGADGLFCRVASQYHDVGKLCNPKFFTENRSLFAVRPMQFSALESAEIILNHISYGIELAKASGLPESFIDIIDEHHGTTLMFSVYHQHLKEHPDTGDADERLFRYSGNKPRTKESTIIMIADSFEAAARSLSEHSIDVLKGLLDKIITRKMMDKQFTESPLTLDELMIVSDAMVRTLYSVLHSRIQYPEISLKPCMLGVV